jgi:hypothetical protein
MSDDDRLGVFWSELVELDKLLRLVGKSVSRLSLEARRKEVERELSRLEEVKSFFEEDE